MLITAAVAKAEIVALIESLTPLRIALGRGRSVTLGRPHIELVANKGIRLRGSSRIVWDVAGVAIPVTLQAWQVLLVPKIVQRGRGRALAFDPVVEELDLKLVPGFLGDKIARAISDGIAQNRDRLALDFARAFAKRFPLPAKLGAGKVVDIRATDGAISITPDELKMTLRFEAAITQVVADVSESRAQLR